jgi:hypothetical protein
VKPQFLVGVSRNALRWQCVALRMTVAVPRLMARTILVLALLGVGPAAWAANAVDTGDAGDAGDSAGVPKPQLPRADATACVEPTQVMRRDHMKFLLHQRDRTVYKAERDSRHSLKGCVACHAQSDASGQALSVNADGQFCSECHTYSAVKIDCFECHASRPAGAVRSKHRVRGQ